MAETPEKNSMGYINSASEKNSLLIQWVLRILYSTFIQSITEKEGLVSEQLCSVDETGLKFKMVPKKTLVTRQEATSTAPQKEQRASNTVTFSNVAGTHKQPLFVLGKSIK
jgi:hypothetical protein